MVAQSVASPPTVAQHPAKFSDEVLEAISRRVVAYAYVRSRHTDEGCRVLDPFAGIGRIHELQDCGLIPGLQTVGVELEVEWANAHPRTICGNALALPFPLHSFDVVATSPVYGNRVSDHHNARDGSRRITYKHKLGRDLHADNAGQLHWGEEYRTFHRAAWAQVIPVLKRGGLFVLNVSDHLKTEHKGEPPVHQYVTDFHVATLGLYGLRLIAWDRVSTRRMRYGANADARVSHESVITFKRDV